jgi:filamentous hemagglutinin family protein
MMLASLLTITTAIPMGTAEAQVTTAITPSGLGTRVAVPKPSAEGLVHEITGGTRVETNLYHGLGRLDLAAGEIANFLNDSGLATSNIFGRVTGGQPSLIFGTLRTTDFPGANLYLMNPAGVLFGSTAVIDLGAITTAPGTRQGGSFFATTADYIRLADGAQFHANPAEPRTSFSASPAAAFGFLVADPAAISIQGTTIQVAETQSLSIVGGNRGFSAESGETTPAGVTLVGATLTAPAGRIQLASVASAGEVLIDTWATGPNVDNVSFTTLGTIKISDSSQVDASGDGGGTITARARDLMMDRAILLADSTGDQPGAPVAIQVNLDGALDLKNGSEMSAGASGVGRSGDVLIAAKTVEVTGGSVIQTLTRGFTAGEQQGNISVTATESVLISGADDNGRSSAIQSLGDAESSTFGGSLTIQTPSLTLHDRGLVYTNSGAFFNEGRAGDIALNVGTLTITQGGAVRSDGGETATSGSIAITATDTVSLAGEITNAEKSRIEVTNLGFGGTGSIAVRTGNLSLGNGARILSDTTFSPTVPNGPAITLNVQNALTVSGRSDIGIRTSLSDIGGLEITARDVTLSDRAIIFTDASSAANGAPIGMTAANLTATGGSRITSGSVGIGNGGDITISLSGALQLRGQVTDQFGQTFSSGLNSSTFAGFQDPALVGNAGHITVNAGSVEVSDNARIDSRSQGFALGNAGNISISSPTILINGGSIATSTEFGGNAGTIMLNTGSLAVSSSGQINSGSVKRTQLFFEGEDVPAPTGAAGTITVKGLASPAQSVLIDGSGSGVFTDTQGTGAGGAIRVETNTLTMQNGGTLSASTSGTDPAAIGGDIRLSVPQSLTMTDQALITTTSSGPANAGSIIMEDPRPANITMTNSAIIANATAAGTQASGGNITLLATNMIRLTDSQINTSVQGGTETVGGKITIDPQFVILQNSQILATAVQGQGGIIQITAGTFLADPSSSVSASSQLGINGTVDIRATVQNLSGALVPLPENLLAGTALVAQRCAARLAEGQISSFVLAGREGLPAEPDGHLGSPLEPRSTGSSGSVAAVPIPTAAAPLVLLAAGPGFGPRLFESPIRAEDFMGACRR